MSGYGNHNGVAAPILGDQAMLSQLLLYMVRICAHAVHLVDSNNNGHLCCLGMVNSLNGLGHYTVVCSNYQNSNVSYLGTTSTHSGEGFVTGGIQKDDLLALVINLICTNVLGNTARFACGYISFANSVQQRGFAVVNVTHNSDYRRTGQALLFGVIYLGNLGGILLRSLLANLYTKVVANQLSGIKVDVLVDGNHHAQHEESLNNLVYFTLNQLSKLLHINGFTNFNIGRTNNLCRCSCSLGRIVRLTVAVYRHLMAGTAVRTAFLGSIGALNLRLFLAALAGIAAFLATGHFCSSLQALVAAFTAAFIATSAAGSIHATAFPVHCLAGLLPLRTYENTALALIIVATTLAIALLAIIATILALALVVAVALLCIIIATVLALTAVVAISLLSVVIALTIFRAALLAIVALILIVLLHIPLTVFIIILLFGLFLLHSLCLTRGFLLLFRFRCRLGRFRLLIVCITNHSHHLFISATKILLLKIMLLEQI